ncbi:MAG: hypothetical protein AB7U73_24020 [Pirellulales bacterium]
MNRRRRDQTVWMAGVMAVGVMLHAPGAARAVAVSFQGTAQHFEFMMTAHGNALFGAPLPISGFLQDTTFAIGNVTLDSNGFTYLVSENPYVAQLQFKQSVLKTTDPRSVTGPAGSTYTPGTVEVSFAPDLRPTGMFGLRLDLLNGAVGNFALTTINVPRTRMKLNELYTGLPANGPAYIPSPMSPISLDTSGSLVSLYLEQDLFSVATFIPDGSDGLTGSFQVPATLYALVDASVTLEGILLDRANHLPLSKSLTLGGRYSVAGPAGQTTLQLAGSSIVSLPSSASYFIHPQFFDLYGVTSSIEITGAALNLIMNYRLTSVVAVPEPGSVVLLAIGLAAFVPLLVRRASRLWR